MQSVYLPYISISLDLLALAVTLIILSSCIREYTGNRSGSKHFLMLLFAVSASLMFNVAALLCEGHIALSALTVTANTLTYCAGQFAIICFMGYLKESLYHTSRSAAIVLRVFYGLFVLSVIFSVGNAFFGYTYSVNSEGHYVHSGNIYTWIAHLLFPALAFISVVCMSIFAKRSTNVSRASFVLYTLFPVAGIVLDHIFHGISLTYVGLTVSVLIIYTSIYLRKQKLIEAQRNALMLSQINPHFVYNTLSTIAAMCDSSPAKAKRLTIDFSSYLRRNLGALSSEELIPFEQELEHVECYLKIEGERFGERLKVVYAIQCKDFMLPPLTVQPIVENAVKHGITKRAEGGTLKISTYSDKRYYYIEIKDDGVGFDTRAALSGDRQHVGLENVRSRVGNLCRGRVTVKSTEGVGTRITIELPRKKGKGK